MEDAKKEADVLLKEASIQAKDITIQAKNEVDQEIKARRSELQDIERRILQKEANLDKKLDNIEKKEGEFSKKEKELAGRQALLDSNIKEYNELLNLERERLEKIAGLTTEEAKKFLIQMMEDEAKHESIKICKRIEEEARERADKKAKEIIALAIQRYAGEYVGEDTVSTVSLPNEEMKGRINGREGRNIKCT